MGQTPQAMEEFLLDGYPEFVETYASPGTRARLASSATAAKLAEYATRFGDL